MLSCLAMTASAALIAFFIAGTGNSPSEVFYSIYRGAFASWFSWQNTLVRAAPLMLTALCTALPARVGLIVIGGEGAFVVGGLCAAIVGIWLSAWPFYVAIVSMFVTGAFVGGAWIAFVGYIKLKRDVNETIGSLLLNYIAIALLSFLVVGPLKDPATLNNPSTYSIGEHHMLANIGESSVHWGLGISIVLCLLMWLLIKKSTFGFAADVCGGNPRTARLVGLPLTKIVFWCCFLGGAAAGIAGTIEITAVQGRANSSLAAGYGYAGILVAFLSRHNPVLIIPFAILLGGIQASGGLLQRAHDLPDATVAVIQGIIFMVILASDMLLGKVGPALQSMKQLRPLKTSSIKL